MLHTRQAVRTARTGAGKTGDATYAGTASDPTLDTARFLPSDPPDAVERRLPPAPAGYGEFLGAELATFPWGRAAAALVICLRRGGAQTAFEVALHVAQGFEAPKERDVGFGEQGRR